jgi:hypothetical protein
MSAFRAGRSSPRTLHWQFERQQIDALLAYLETVQVPEEG